MRVVTPFAGHGDLGESRGPHSQAIPSYNRELTWYRSKHEMGEVWVGKREEKGQLGVEHAVDEGVRMNIFECHCDFTVTSTLWWPSLDARL